MTKCSICCRRVRDLRCRGRTRPGIKRAPDAGPKSSPPAKLTQHFVSGRLARPASQSAGVADEVGDAVVARVVPLSVHVDGCLSDLLTQARSRSRALGFLVAAVARRDEA